MSDSSLVLSVWLLLLLRARSAPSTIAGVVRVVAVVVGP